MKKIILLSIAVVLVISLSLVGFVGCKSNTSLTQIFSEYNIWRSANLPETFTYTMYKTGDTTAMGTLEMTVEGLSKSATYYLGKTGLTDEANAIYSITTESVNDTFKATTTLKTDDGKYEKTTIALFTKSYQILGSYSYTNNDGAESSFVSYNVNNKRFLVTLLESICNKWFKNVYFDIRENFKKSFFEAVGSCQTFGDTHCFPRSAKRN